MHQIDVAREFIRCFCEADATALAATLHEDLRFSGPFQTCHSAAEYMDSLRTSGLEPSDYRIIEELEQGNRIAIFYEYLKPGGSITIGQLFVFRRGLIGEILLVFDSAQVAGHAADGRSPRSLDR